MELDALSQHLGGNPMTEGEVVAQDPSNQTQLICLDAFLEKRYILLQSC